MKKYENQYVLLEKNVKFRIDNDWEQVKLLDYNLYHCPNLSSFRYTSKNSQIILLGFCFHVLNPSWDEEDIVSNIPLDKATFLDYLDCLCGNYILLIEIDGELILFNDPAAALKMFYYIEDNYVLGVGPDPAILNEHLELRELDDKDSLEYYKSAFFQQTFIRLGNKTIYKNTFQVLPNHSLSLRDSVPRRYFPREKKSEIGLHDAIEMVHEYFTNCLEAASRKFELKCSITSGWDSRIVTSLTKNYHDIIEYYTFINPPHKERHPDIKIPKKISNKLNLNYKQYERLLTLEDEEIKLAKESFTWLGEQNIKHLLGGFSIFNKPNQLLLIGNVSEICKNYFDEALIKDGKSLTKAAHFPVMEYTTKHFNELYDELKEIESAFNYDLRDIAHWEQDITNFAAMGIMYRSLTTKTFSPFNCRLILKTILSTPRKYRDKQQHHFYKTYIEKYYPELGKFSINPNSKRQLIVLTKKLGIYKAYKILSTKLRK